MAQKDGDCYVDVWRDANFGGERIRICGPAEYPHLDFAQGHWGDDIGSLRVGPNAFVMAFRGRDFRDGLVTFGPFDEVADLSALKFDDEIESLKVIDSLKIFDRAGYNNGGGAPAAPAPPAGPNRGKRRGGRRR